MHVVGRLAVGAFVLIGIACSTISDGPIGSSSEKITSVAPNYQAVGNNDHYASVAEAYGGPLQNFHYVVAFDDYSDSYPPGPWVITADPNGKIAWAYSSDLTASTWTPVIPAFGTEETTWIPFNGPPSCHTAGCTFKGWGGDSTIAQIGQDNLPGQLIMATLAESNDATAYQASDIATLLSTNGGQTWGAPFPSNTVQYISNPNGLGCDQPQVVTNQKFPYSTFVAYSCGGTTYPPATTIGWFTSLNNTNTPWLGAPGISSSAPTGVWTGQPKYILNSGTNLGQQIIRPKIAVGNITWPAACGSPPGGVHELVYFAWAEGAWFPRSCPNGYPPAYLPWPNSPAPITWNAAVWDNTAGTWFSGFGGTSPYLQLDRDPMWDLCVGGGNVSPTAADSNSAQPSLATDGATVAIAFVRSGTGSSMGLGTRIQMASFGMAVNTTTCTLEQDPHLPLNLTMAPSPCYYASGGWSDTWCPPGSGGGGGHNGADGGNVINDQWGPQMAYQLVGLHEKFVVTWYDTAGDTTNTMARVMGAGNVNGMPAFGSPFFTTSLGVDGGPVFTATISQISVPVGAQVIPWAHSQTNWYDYEGIGVDYYAQNGGKMLAAWGGDARNVPGGGASGVWTALLTP